MRIIFLLYHGFSESSGISKKILCQIKALRELGHRVNVCTYDMNKNRHRVRMMDEEIIEDYGTGKWQPSGKGFHTMASTAMPLLRRST